MTTSITLDPGVPLDELQLKTLLASRGVAVPRSHRWTPSSATPLAAIEFPGPYVVKVLDGALLHKSDVGGVRLDVAADVLEDVALAMATRFPGRDVLIEEMVRTSGVEAIIGILVDDDFGPAVMFGLGGVLTEVFKDVTFRLPPLTSVDVDDMIASLAARPVLEGFRGRAISREALTKLLVTAGELAIELAPYLGQIDLNPVLLTPTKAVVLDAKMAPGAGPAKRESLTIGYFR